MQASNESRNHDIGVRTFASERVEVRIQLLVKRPDDKRPGGDAAAPEPIHGQEMVERAVDGAEKITEVACARFIRYAGANRVELLVHPAVVITHQCQQARFNHSGFSFAHSQNKMAVSADRAAILRLIVCRAAALLTRDRSQAPLAAQTLMQGSATPVKIKPAVATRSA